MKALIFGANGQDGRYLTALLKSNNIETVKISRNGEAINGDVGNFSFVENQIKYHKPAFIFHLAANSTTKHYALFENHETISTGTLNILESVRLHCAEAKVFLSGSAMQFINEGRPINELTSFDASSAYAVARIQSVYAGRYYRNVFGLKVYVGYFFNHDSPLRGEQHVNQKIARAAQRIARGSNELLELGNIDIQKEFNYAGDCMEAIWTLVNQNTIFEAVIGSGKACKIKDWVIGCFDKIGVNWENFVKIKQDFVPEYQILVSDPQLIYSLGWQPRIDFNQLIDLMMNNY